MTRRLKDIGDWGENQACEFLRRHGFVVVERNYHTTTGEIDIVARQGSDFYFIEVKTRLNKELANDSAVTGKKKMRFERAVRAYCYRRDIPDVGLVMAGLIVYVDKINKKVSFRLAVWC